ncbi:alpha/beta fold hydrolase [Maricaulis sp.]|uniref:alpha/beta hydrolase n=1 Tax=Maricaulis sp. TaxID=1486257 RepID=UPI002B271BEC|nr:alpha/beta fold hydrolase [Maricaulis sp.]
MKIVTEQGIRGAVALAAAMMSSLLVLQSPVLAQAVDEEIRIANPNAASVTLGATLTLPDGDGPFPGVVMISGSGPQDRDSHDPGLGEHRPFAVWAEHLAANGIAVLRYDDRGVGQSTGDFAAATATDLASDARAALTELRGHPSIDPRRAGLVGHSEGGAIAMMVAGDMDPSFVVMLAAPAVAFREVFSGQYLAQQLVGDDPQAALDANQQFLSMIYATLDGVAGEPEAEARARLAGVFDTLGLPHEAGLDTLSSAYIRGWLEHDMRATLRDYDGPVLGVYGEHDLSVNPIQNAAALGGAIDPQIGSRVTVLRGKNHLLQSVTDAMANPAEQDHAVAQDVLELVAHWLGERADLAMPAASAE